MAAIRFRIAVTESGYLTAPVLSPEQLRYIGDGMVAAQKNRWLHGVNAQDAPAKPLRPVTAKGKVTYGAQPIRNMLMTGLMMGNFRLTRASGQVIRAENTSRNARMHARKAQSFETMIGFAPSDENTIFRLAYQAYGIYLERAWRRTRG